MPVAQPKTPTFPPWKFQEGAGWTRAFGPILLHVWEAKFPTQRRPAKFPWVARLANGYQLATNINDCPETETAIGSMEGAERFCIEWAESILAARP